MSKKERKTRQRKINVCTMIVIIMVAIIAIIGLISIGIFGGCKILGYDIEISKPDPMNEPQSALLDSPNNQYHILQQVDNKDEFWRTVENMELNQQVEVIYYTAIPYQRNDGTWGNIYITSYQTR